MANGGGDLIVVPMGSSALFMGNLYFSSDTFKIQYQGITYNGLTDFRNTNNEFMEGSSFGHLGNPLLVNAGNGGTIGFDNLLSNLDAYQLTQPSPAIDAGIDIEISDTQDFYGNLPIVNGKRDIGAHEFNGTLFTEIHSKENHLKIFTNLNDSKLVVLSEELILLQVQLVDINGRIISDFKQNQDLALKRISFNLTDIEKGIYLLKIKTPTQMLVKKIIYH